MLQLGVFMEIVLIHRRISVSSIFKHFVDMVSRNIRG